MAGNETETDIRGFFNTVFKKDILRAVILLRISRGSGVYPYSLLKSFKNHPAQMMEGGIAKSDIYNAMASLEKSGFITGNVIVSGSRAKKTYVLTDKGRKVVGRFRKQLLKYMKAMSKVVKAELEG